MRARSGSARTHAPVPAHTHARAHGQAPGRTHDGALPTLVERPMEKPGTGRWLAKAFAKPGEGRSIVPGGEGPRAIIGGLSGACERSAQVEAHSLDTASQKRAVVTRDPAVREGHAENDGPSNGHEAPSVGGT